MLDVLGEWLWEISLLLIVIGYWVQRRFTGYNFVNGHKHLISFDSAYACYDGLSGEEKSGVDLGFAAPVFYHPLLLLDRK